LPEGTEYYKVWYGEEDEDTKEIKPGSEFIG
jgi:hypothetical protein